MLNRFWMVAALAAVFAFCSLSGAQDKKGVASRTGKLATKANALKNVEGTIEKSRAIDVGAPSGSDVAKDIESLTKILQSLGLKTRAIGDLQVVNVRGLDLAYQMIGKNNEGVWFNSVTIKLKEPSQLASDKLLGLIAAQGVLSGAWTVEEGTLYRALALESRIADRSAINLRLNNLVNSWIESEKILDEIQAPNPSK
jgi:hypothetical protein